MITTRGQQHPELASSAARRASTPPATSRQRQRAPRVEPSAGEHLRRSRSATRCGGCRRRRSACASPGVGPASPPTSSRSRQHEQRDGERRDQGRELEPEPARSDPRATRTRSSGSSRRSPGRRRRSARRPARGSRGSRRYRETTTAATITATTIPNTSAPLPAISVARSRLCGEGVAEQAERRRPQPGAEHAVRDEGAVAHPRAAGDERRQRPDEPDEATDQDRLAAVAAEVAPRPARSAHA